MRIIVKVKLKLIVLSSIIFTAMKLHLPRLLLILLICLPAVSIAQHQNIMISSDNNPEEPSIHVNPRNTNEVMAASNINNLYYSKDAGLTWEHDTVYSSLGVWGDPCIITDTAGHFYFFHLSNPSSGNWIDRIVCQRADSIDGSWNNGSWAGLNGTKAQDKEWAAVDPATNIIHMTWTQFDVYGSSQPGDSSIILYSNSADQGLTWSTPRRLNKIAGDCLDDDLTVEGAVPAIGPNGEIYVAWAGPEGILFDRSLDGGNTWLNTDIFVDPMPDGWNYEVSGIYRANGLPVTTCDISGGPQHGTIYINWTDQRYGTTDTDVWLAKSTDGGNTWTTGIRVNDDPPGKQQFFTWMDIDQTNGYLYFVFYDRRDRQGDSTDVFMAVSRDGGQSFNNFRISASPFVPSDNVFFGDYTNISAHDNVVRPIWTRLHNNQLSVWTAIPDMNLVGIDTPEESMPLLSAVAYPNPSEGSVVLSFKVHRDLDATLRILSSEGKIVALVFQDRHLPYGKYIERINTEELDLAPGVYFLELRSPEHSLTRKIVVGP